MLCKFILTDFSAFSGKQPLGYEKMETDMNPPIYVGYHNSPAIPQSAGTFFKWPESRLSPYI